MCGMEGAEPGLWQGGAVPPPHTNSPLLITLNMHDRPRDPAPLTHTPLLTPLSCTTSPAPAPPHTHTPLLTTPVLCDFAARLLGEPSTRRPGPPAPCATARLATSCAPATCCIKGPGEGVSGMVMLRRLCRAPGPCVPCREGRGEEPAQTFVLPPPATAFGHTPCCPWPLSLVPLGPSC